MTPTIAAVQRSSDVSLHLLMMVMLGLGFATQKIALTIWLWIWEGIGPLVSNPWFYIPYSIYVALCIAAILYAERDPHGSYPA